jgi:hypothetical protein
MTKHVEFNDHLINDAFFAAYFIDTEKNTFKNMILVKGLHALLALEPFVDIKENKMTLSFLSNKDCDKVLMRSEDGEWEEEIEKN